MRADPLRGRFSSIGTDCLVMPFLAVISIQSAHRHWAEIFNLHGLLPLGITLSFLIWLSLFEIASHVLFSFSNLHRCRARSRSMLLVVLLYASSVTTYILAFYLVMAHLTASYPGVLITFFIVSFLYQALHYKLRINQLLRNQEAVLILGTGREAQKMWKHIRIQCDHLLAFKGFVRESAKDDAAPDVLARTVCTIDSLEHFLQSNIVDTMVLTANSRKDFAFAQESIHIAQHWGIRLLCINEAYEDLPPTPALHSISDTYVDFERLTLLQQASRAIKAAMDRVLAAAVLAALTPVILPLLIVYRLILRETALVSQSVCGYHRHSFTMWNLRTPLADTALFLDDADTHDRGLSSVRKQLGWRIGHFLQESGLSHVPRLWNVCTGDMSLVGPTPIPRTQPSLIGLNGPLRRYAMRPGLCSPVAEASAEVSATERLEEEATLSYLQHWSLSLDWNTFRHWLRSRCNPSRHHC
jgi:lipopolysaccharide/colanic/teichoic acid biosynthesis glycosyltransferase